MANNNYIAKLSHINGMGLWILPSYFNHSCVDVNVYNYFLGDLMFIRTLRPINKGEELITSYTLDYANYENRYNYLKLMDIDCQCRLCKLDSSEARKIKLRRDQLLETYKKSIKPRLSSDVGSSFIKKFENVISELRSLRKENPDLEFDSIELIIEVLESAYTSKIPIDITILKEAYNFSKNVRWLPYSGKIALSIFKFYNIRNEKKEYSEWSKWLDIALKECVEPVRGKFKMNEPNWKEEALLLMEKVMLEDADLIV